MNSTFTKYGYTFKSLKVIILGFWTIVKLGNSLNWDINEAGTLSSFKTTYVGIGNAVDWSISITIAQNKRKERNTDMNMIIFVQKLSDTEQNIEWPQFAVIDSFDLIKDFFEMAFGISAQ